MQEKKHIIWSDYNLHYEDWKNVLEEQYPDLTEEQRYYLMYEININHLDDERANLSIQLSQPIIVISDFGLRHSETPGYRMIDSGNIKDCLFPQYDCNEWYVDKNGDLRSISTRHDGTNQYLFRYLFRVFRDGVSEDQINRLQMKIYNGAATRSDITRLTRRLGDEIGRVYGWEFPQRQRRQKETVRQEEDMARINAMTEQFEEIEVLDRPALFTCLRVDRNTVPKGLYLYEVRHDDDQNGIPCQIARGIMVNHWGTILTREPVKLPRDGYLDIEPDDWNYAAGDCRTVKEFMKKYPPIKTKYEPER